MLPMLEAVIVGIGRLKTREHSYDEDKNVSWQHFGNKNPANHKNDIPYHAK